MQAWSVGQRITSGFAIVLALLAGLAAVSYFATDKMSSVFTDYRSTARQTLLVNDLVEDLFEARMSAMKYRISPSAASAEAVESNLAEITDSRSRVVELFGDDESVMAQFDMMAADTTTYLNAFTEMTGLQAEREALVSVLVELGPKARKQLTTIMETAYRDGDADAAYYAGIAQQELMLGRFYTERFLLTNSDAAFTRAGGHLAAAQSGLEVLLTKLENPDRRNNANATIADLEAYLSTSQELNGVIATRNQIRTGVLDVIGPKKQTEYETLLDTIVARQNVLGPQGSSTAIQTEKSVVLIALLAIALGAGLAYIIPRSIARSVNKIAGNMGELANDNLDIEIEGAEHKHELGQMAQALEVFRKNAIRVREMTTEKEESDARSTEDRRRMMEELRTAFGTVVDGAVAGDFSGRVPAKFPDKELNELALGVNRLLETVNSGVGETGRVLARVADGDLRDRMVGEFSGAFSDLQSNVNQTVEQLSSMLGEIASTTTSVRSSADVINETSEALSRRAMQQASSLEETAATMEEMSASVKSNADSSSSAKRLAGEASERAGAGGEIVNSAVSAMSQIEESSSKIADIISVIDGIAFQTNLLALNAAVEAARAGDAGKGFAVVASEVRALAQRSSEAASDISRLIKTSEEQVAVGVKLVTETGSSLEGIVSSISLVEDAIRSIASASEQQSSGVQEITSAIGEIDAITQKNSSMAEQSASSAHSLASGAQKLEQLLGFFKVVQAEMKSSARAA